MLFLSSGDRGFGTSERVRQKCNGAKRQLCDSDPCTHVHSFVIQYISLFNGGSGALLVRVCSRTMGRGRGFGSWRIHGAYIREDIYVTGEYKTARRRSRWRSTSSVKKMRAQYGGLWAEMPWIFLWGAGFLLAFPVIVGWGSRKRPVPPPTVAGSGLQFMDGEKPQFLAPWLPVCDTHLPTPNDGP